MMLSFEERVKKLNSTIRMEIAAHYVAARGIDPSRKPGNTRNLVSSLIIATKRTGEYDELKPVLESCAKLCENAERLYRAGNWQGSNEICGTVMDEVGVYVHEGYGQFNAGSFKFEGGAE